MKILFIGPMPPPFGGVAVINKSLQNLDFGGRYVPVVFDTSKGSKNEDLYSRKGCSNIWHLIGNILGALKHIRAPDIPIVNIFVTSNIAFLRDALLILLLKLHGKRVIVHFHSKKNGEFFLSRFSIWFVSAIFRVVDKIIVLSPNHYDFFSDFFQEDKMEVLENFVDTRKYDCELQDKVNEFLYVGRLSQRKGFFDLLRAIEKLKDKGLTPLVHIIGVAENDEVQKAIDIQIEKNDISAQLIFHGALFGDEKIHLFRRCAFLVFPTHFENSPVVLKEAMAAKMEIISTNLEANEAVLVGFENVTYVDPCDPQSFFLAMYTVLEGRVSSDGYYSYSCESFDIKYTTRRFMEILESVA